MKIATIILSVLVAASIGGSGYFYVTQHQPMQDDLQMISAKKDDLERRVTDLNRELNLKVAEISKTKQEKATKTKATRKVPVHPTLAAMLAEWRLQGWPKHCARTPKAYG